MHFNVISFQSNLLIWCYVICYSPTLSLTKTKFKSKFSSNANFLYQISFLINQLNSNSKKKDYKKVSDDQYSNRFFVNFVYFILFIHWSIDDSFILMMHSTIYQPKNRRFNVSVLILKFIIKTNYLHILFRIFSLILMILSLISTTMILIFTLMVNLFCTFH